MARQKKRVLLNKKRPPQIRVAEHSFRLPVNFKDTWQGAILSDSARNNWSSADPDFWSKQTYDRGSMSALGLKTPMGILGLGAALALSRLLASLLVGITPHDPGSFSFTWALMTIVALLTSAIPASQAARTDLIAVLHSDWCSQPPTAPQRMKVSP
jgi:hypothetical protein